jgi:dTDP-4-amino-4,6-dideoxygalactose transaminase
MSKAYDVVRTFEYEIASWAGSKYAISVESLKYINLKKNTKICIPDRTYPGVGMAVVNSGYKPYFSSLEWEGIYKLGHTNIIDSALRFKQEMYIKNTLYCLSFHSKKLLPIGRGGMILTNDKKAMEWLRMARFDGRQEIPLKEDNASFCGWNMYMTPEQASRGLTLFDVIKNKNQEDLKVENQNYPYLPNWRCFK